MNTYKKYIICVVMILFNMFPVKEALAESKDYQSNGDISFYGTYEYPTTVSPGVVQPPNGELATELPSNIGRFPQTGELEIQKIKGIGILLISGSIMLYYKKIRRNKNEIN